MVAKILAIVAVVVMAVSIVMAFIHPDLSGLQSLWDGFWQQVRDFADFIGRVIGAALREFGSPKVDIAVDPMWILIALASGAFLLWIIFRRVH